MFEPTILIDDAAHGRACHFARPRGIITAHTQDEVAAALGALETCREMGLYTAGYFSYELSYALEPKLVRHMPVQREVPLLWFGVFDAPEKITNIDTWFEEHCTGRASAGTLHYDWDADTYRDRFTRVRNLIAAGDLYEANLTFQAAFSFIGDPLALYRSLRARSVMPHGAFIDDGERRILSLSPELFFDITQDTITARPMKGTAPRMPNRHDDDMMRGALFNSAKDRAENLMIVDLMRNDLSRIAQAGSVTASDLFTIETYPTVHQMVSTISAQIKVGMSVRDIIQALFPCGSITGAPKIRAMEVLRETETAARGVYTGSIGYFAPNGDACFNVAIRTLTITGPRDGRASGRLGIGSAVVYDSDAAGEYAECQMKARYLTVGQQPLSLIETLNYTPEIGFTRLARHMARLTQSATALHIPLDIAAAENALYDAVRDTQQALRVRLALGEDGAVSVTTATLPPPAALWRYAVSPRTISSRDIFARHKTSLRTLYESEYSRLNTLTGCDEVLFFNERGELAEGSRSNIFIRRDGVLLTPPLTSGALPGVLRQELIEMGQVQEAILTKADLAKAEQDDEICLGNSLRGLIRACPAT